MNRLALIFAVLLAGCDLALAQDTNFATRIDCETQTAGLSSLPDLTWIQGSSPMLELRPMRNGRLVPASTVTTVRVLFGASAAASEYAVATNFWPSTNAASYFVQFGAIGTNTLGTNDTAQAWFYTVYFRDAAGYDYWNGAGRLYIEESTSLADGLTWISATNLARVAWGNIDGSLTNQADLVDYIAAQAGADTEARAGVASNAADIAIMQTGKLDVATAATTYQPAGDYALTTALAGYVHMNRTLTINGVAYDLSADRSWTVEGGTGTGWTNLAFSGTGNAITGATASGTTLTLERGTIGGGGTASVGVEGDVLTYAFSTNIALLASTNFWPQRILEVTNDFTLQVPTMSDTNSAGIIWLTVPSLGAYTATIPTNSPPILGYVPSLATNAESELLFRWSPQATGWRVRRIR